MNVAKELWQKMLRTLETEIAAVNFDAWIEPLEPVRIMDSKLVLCATNVHIRNFVTDKFLPQLVATMTAVNPLMMDVILIEPSEKEAYRAKEETYIIEENVPSVPVPAQTVINPKYNFENFVVGKSNQFVYAAARAVSDEPGVRYNPLFIYGDSGLGKTHIMHAIGNFVRLTQPQLKVLYAPAEKFVNDFIESIRTAKGDSSRFRDKYRSVDILMIDDIQFIAGKDSSQEAMFNTFNELHQANKQLVFTSDRPPKEILQIDERLRSRFEWGLMADILPPDLETRIAILQKKAQIEKYNIPLPVLSFMASAMTGNVREMESLLNKVILLSRLYEQEPSVATVKEALKDYADKSEEAITGERIIDCSCKYYAVQKADLCGKLRNREISVPRQVCIYVMTELTAMPLAAIGEIMGGRDHTTVMHARDKIAAQMQTDIKIKTAVNDIKEMALRR